jgi:hypothetical protein
MLGSIYRDCQSQADDKFKYAVYYESCDKMHSIHTKVVTILWLYLLWNTTVEEDGLSWSKRSGIISWCDLYVVWRIQIIGELFEVVVSFFINWQINFETRNNDEFNCLDELRRISEQCLMASTRELKVRLQAKQKSHIYGPAKQVNISIRTSQN